MHLLIEELPADLVLPGQLGDRFRPGEHLDGQVLPLLRRPMTWQETKHRHRSERPSRPVIEGKSHCEAEKCEVA